MPSIDELTELLAQTDQKDLDTVLERVREIRDAKEWPKETTVYLHADEDSNYDTAKDLGLTEDAIETFRGTGYEVGLIVTVTKDGQAMLTAIEGQDGPIKLVEPMRI